MFFVEEFHHLKIQLQDIILATDNFSSNKVIGHGGFGKVYKGELSLSERESMVAVKRLDPKFGQGNTEFWKEIMMLSKYKHENLVSLLHFCFEGDEMILVYEYASRGSLDRHLSDANLTWIQRLKICIGVARGLNYLHDPRDTKQRILHRDIKSSNILLDEEWNAKVSDFGLSKVGPANQPHTYLVSNVVGTFGYCDPSYFETGLLSKESDVYSFGAVLFEVLCGSLCCEHTNGETRILIPTWKKCFEEERIDDIIFRELKGQVNHDSVMTFSTIANQCLQRDHKKQPTMVKIVQQLEVAIEQQLGVNRNEEDGKILLQKADKLLLEISELATKESLNPRHISVKNDELVNLGSKGEEGPWVLLNMSPLTNWWVIDQGLTRGRKLPVLSSDDNFNQGHKESLCGGKHLLISGSEQESIVIWRFELPTNKWYKGPSMINPRRLFATTTCGNSAFVAGGTAVYAGTTGITIVLNTVEKYDAETRSWTPLPRMKKPRQLCSACYMDDRFYVIGGKNNDEGELTCGEFFDQKTNQWTLISDMLKENPVLGGHSPPLVAVVDNELYSMDTFSNELKVYKKSTNIWKSLGPVPVGANQYKGWGVAFKSFGNELLVVGASSSSLVMYTCIPTKPQSDHLPEWKLRDYGNDLLQLGCFVYHCNVML